eukprot:CAMPEP_0168395394 /NCGR_PEP_ID=MMETSP0228-20121227/20021_1 /TAXON_ID=133427 /ORGANISM="Protoceratium reticulatum, Strain CCCM 535 (=CCMP 1889)" /LENGTH=203 /DNA_ID=CAMNT_0008408825 /DNA_START=100 /DNA_END=711 /DNA_ORIENTATION=+
MNRMPQPRVASVATVACGLSLCRPARGEWWPPESHWVLSPFGAAEALLEAPDVAHAPLLRAAALGIVACLAVSPRQRAPAAVPRAAGGLARGRHSRLGAECQAAWTGEYEAFMGAAYGALAQDGAAVGVSKAEAPRDDEVDLDIGDRATLPHGAPEASAADEEDEGEHWGSFACSQQSTLERDYGATLEDEYRALVAQLEIGA